METLAQDRARRAAFRGESPSSSIVAILNGQRLSERQVAGHTQRAVITYRLLLAASYLRQLRLIVAG